MEILLPERVLVHAGGSLKCLLLSIIHNCRNRQCEIEKKYSKVGISEASAQLSNEATNVPCYGYLYQDQIILVKVVMWVHISSLYAIKMLANMAPVSRHLFHPLSRQGTIKLQYLYTFRITKTGFLANSYRIILQKNLLPTYTMHNITIMLRF